MAFFTLNGLTVNVQSCNTQRVEIGDRSRAFSGVLRATLRAVKNEWTCQAVPLPLAEADCLARLLEGDGHSWPFDLDLASSRGLLPSANVGGTVDSPNAGKFGFPLKTTGYTTWQPEHGTAWTVLAWRRRGLSWDHWIVTSEPVLYGGYPVQRRWRNGSASTDASQFLRVESGELSLLSETNAWTNVVGGGAWGVTTYGAGSAFNIGDYTVQARFGGDLLIWRCVESSGAPDAGDIDFAQPWNNVGDVSEPDGISGATFVSDGLVRVSGQAYGYYDDLVVLPYVLPDAWIALVYAAHAARAWSALPRLVLSGEVVGGQSVTVAGRSLGRQHLQGYLDGSFQPLATCEFLLMEV
jgi:hypothetical protein